MPDRRSLAVLLTLALGVAGLLMVYLRAQEHAAIDAAREPIPADPAADKAPIVCSVLRALKLVTVEITVGVASDSVDRSWRGDVEARVEAPVRYYYGVDLEDLGNDAPSAPALSRDPITGAYRLRVQPPHRLAVEVVGLDERPSVRVDGTRFRGIAGEYHLGLARAGLYASARAHALTTDERRRVERMTREQLTTLVRAFVGPDEPVEIEFIDGPAREIAGPAGADNVPETAR